LELDEMLLIQLQERTDKMRLIYAEYNLQTNSIDVTTFENYMLRIDCNKAEDGLKTTLCSQNSLNALAIDEPLEYARLALDGEMQAWVDAIDSQVLFL
jgi:hypothetical protein